LTLPAFLDKVTENDVMLALLEDAILETRLNQLVARAYPIGGWSEYRWWINEHSNPPDQIRNFETAGVILQPKQLEFAAWARRMDTATTIDSEGGTPELGFGGAKGPGKSFGIFAQVALDDCQRFAGLKVLYLRQVGKNAQEQIEDLVKSVLPYTPHVYTQGRVRFPNGSQIRIGHFSNEKDALKYAGIEYDVIIIEETTQLSLKAYKALRQSARTSKHWRPRTYNSTNPLGVGHQWYKKRFIDHEYDNAPKQDRTRKFIFATIDDNHFVNEDYVGNLDDLVGAELKAYRHGDWSVSAGAYFENWDRAIHIKPEFDRIPMYWEVWGSMDYGFQHWNFFHLHAKDSDGNKYTFAEIAHRKHYPHEIAPVLREVVTRYGVHLNHVKFRAGNDVFNRMGNAEKTVAEQYKELGVRLEPADTSAGSRITGAHEISRLLGNPERDVAPRWFITENCPRLIDTLPYLERDPNNPEDVKKVDCDESGAGGDDAYDCARYGLVKQKSKGVAII
jgi:phage terminase large subunit